MNLFRASLRRPLRKQTINTVPEQQDSRSRPSPRLGTSRDFTGYPTNHGLGVDLPKSRKPATALRRNEPVVLRWPTPSLRRGCAGVLGVVVLRLRDIALAVESYSTRIEIHRVGGE